MKWIRTKLVEFPPPQAAKVDSTWDLLLELRPPARGDVGEMLSYCTKVIIAAQEARRALHDGCYTPRAVPTVVTQRRDVLTSLGITDEEFNSLLDGVKPC